MTEDDHSQTIPGPRVIKHLPDDATMHHEHTEELYAAAVREGLAELDQGKGVAPAEVKRQFDSWFSK